MSPELGLSPIVLQRFIDLAMALAPTLYDLKRRLDELSRDANQALGKKTAEITAKAAGAGALGGSRLKILYAEALEHHWREFVIVTLREARRYLNRGSLDETDVRRVLESSWTSIFPKLVAASRVTFQPRGFQTSLPEGIEERVEMIRSFADGRLRDFDIGLDGGPPAFDGLSADLMPSVHLPGSGRRSSGTTHADILRATDVSTGPPKIGAPTLDQVHNPSVDSIAIDGDDVTINGENIDMGARPSALIQSDNSEQTQATSSPEIVVHPPQRIHSAADRRTVIRVVAPHTRDLVDELIQRIAEERDNEPPAGEALDALRELRHALDNLIALAEAEQPLGTAMKIVRTLEAKAAAALSNTTYIGKNLTLTAAISMFATGIWGIQVDGTFAAALFYALSEGKITRPKK